MRRECIAPEEGTDEWAQLVEDFQYCFANSNWRISHPRNISVISVHREHLQLQEV
jgi:hypothetical protein